MGPESGTENPTETTCNIFNSGTGTLSLNIPGQKVYLTNSPENTEAPEIDEVVVIDVTSPGGNVSGGNYRGAYGGGVYGGNPTACDNPEYADILIPGFESSDSSIPNNQSQDITSLFGLQIGTFQISGVAYSSSQSSYGSSDIFLCTIPCNTLIQNPSFEDPPVFLPSTWTNEGKEISYWEDISPAECGIELQRIYTPFDGLQYIELDSNCNSIVHQTVHTTSGVTYILSFAYSPRPGAPESTELIIVSWNGDPVGEVSRDGSQNSDTEWSVETLVVVGTGTDDLSFYSLIDSTTGGFVDFVNLCPQ